MDQTQKKTLRILALLGLAYFILFAFPNASTMGSDNPIVYLHTDEYVIYPVLWRMLSFDGVPSNPWGNLIVYGEYHYGFPFFFLSALVLLPLRLLRGPGFFDDIPLNIFLLRQIINVIPMALTAGVLTWVQTHFRSVWKSVFIFLFILTIPAVVRSNMHWWHPDSLMLLAIALTFYFLDRDQYALDRHFYLAAIACGIASAIKLMGFFFFLAIPLYLLIAWQKRKLAIKTLLLSGLFFVVVMVVVILFSNPFVFYDPPRAEMLAIQEFKTYELREGYPHEEDPNYALGPQFWNWTLNFSYGRPWRLGVLFISLIVCCLWGAQREINWVILAWCLPIGIYLMWFVSPKPDHYLLPLMLPVSSAVLGLVEGFEKVLETNVKWKRMGGVTGLLIFAAIIILPQLFFHIRRGWELYMAFFV